MRKYVILFLIGLRFMTAQANPVDGMLERMQKGLSRRFDVEIEVSPKGEDYFYLSGGGKKVRVRANNYVSAASGIHWYLKYHCRVGFSYSDTRLPMLPKKLPAVDEKRSTRLTANFYMNYCTFSYTTAFWNWERWEREIDFMALNGINIPMAMVGSEVVWRNTLRRFNYSDEEIKEFLCGPAYMGWLLMGNLEKIGGPLPDEWFDRQERLQKKIVRRMREWGMRPVFQGFFGMVPASLAQKYPKADLVEQGSWNGLHRPPVLNPSDSLFSAMAGVWYDEYEKLYGKGDFFGGDLFHEGGKTGGINITEAVDKVQEAMTRYNPKAVWVIQSWGGNPKKVLLDGLEKENTLVVDLCAEFWDHWRQRRGFEGFPGCGRILQTMGGTSDCMDAWMR